jgi:hypothetical protein
MSGFRVAARCFVASMKREATKARCRFVGRIL